MTNSDTIFALSTAPGVAGVAVVRLSGGASKSVLEALSGKANWQPNLMAHSRFYDFSGGLIDEGLAVYFAAPRSFTGEDVVELNIHGSRATVERLLEVLGDFPGLRLANRGEFSRRAFENGKMDLTEVEGLSDLINADTELQRQQSIRQMGGELSRVYDGWRREVIKLLAELEATIDFSDDEIPDDLDERAASKIRELKAKMEEHLAAGKRAKRLREGIAVAILGEPNVGKSSLFNAILGREQAIVSKIPGTTRDVIEAYIDIKGYPIILADTAGIRETLDEVETEGVRRAYERAENADLQIWLFDDVKKLPKGPEKDKIYVLSKADLQQNMPNGVLAVSSQTGVGINELINKITELAGSLAGLSESPLMTRARHAELIKSAVLSLELASAETAIDLKSEQVRCAAKSLDELIGRVDVEEVLDVIFGEFCIGK